MTKQKIIIGITGTLGAGKGTIVNYLKQKGFKHYSVREFLIKEIKKRNMAVNRDSMVIVANDLREKHSAGYIMQELYNQAKEAGGNCIIESIRTVGEVEQLRTKNNFYLLAIDAPIKLRYKRIVKRNSETDKLSFEEFIANEKREMESEDPSKQNLAKCIEMADYMLDNSKAFKDLYKQVDKTLKKIL